ncbi:hypothetical protein FB480_1101 [Agrobacterium vitis]|nr:hypothetical protein FB480_1101 [Agrobacterium vitis]
MESIVTCMECFVQDGVPNMMSTQMGRVEDSRVIEYICPKGHRTVTIIQQEKFELLSEMAIKAIVDGYYRDAVASFSGALERLYEFFTKITCRKRGIKNDEFSKFWNPLSKQSERQLGAFATAFLIETEATPKLLANNQTTLRNEVIHKGKFPTREETIRFGQAVADCAHPILEKLRAEPYKSLVTELVMEDSLLRSKAALEENIRVSSCHITTPFSLTYSEVQIDIEKAVSSYAARPDMRKL